MAKVTDNQGNIITVNGVFNYSPTLTFTYGDFVIYNQEIYFCINETTGENPPSSNNFINYTLKNAINTQSEYEDALINNDLNKVITLRGLINIMNNLFAGAIGNGNISEITSGDLNDYKISGRFMIKVNNTSNIINLPALPTDSSYVYYLLDIYKSNTDIFQVVTEANSGRSFLRRYKNNAWGTWISANPYYATTQQAADSITNAINRLTLLEQQVNDLISNFSKYTEVELYFSGSSGAITIQDNDIVKVKLLLKNNSNLQSFIDEYIIGGEMSGSVSSYNIYGNQHTFTASSGWVIEKVFVSREKTL